MTISQAMCRHGALPISQPKGLQKQYNTKLGGVVVAMQYVAWNP